jgi:hypothetical protein
MAFFMLACRRTSEYLLIIIFSFLLSTWTGSAFARGFTIDNIESRVEERTIHLDGNLTITLTEDVRNALSKSIPLQLNMEFVLNRVRRFVWDKEVAVWTVPVVISYKPVSDEYVVSRPDMINQEETFSTQHAALERVGIFDDLNLPLPQPLIDGKEYILEARIKLDLTELPAMMRPLAYFSSSWHLNSKWTQWPLKH